MILKKYIPDEVREAIAQYAKESGEDFDALIQKEIEIRKRLEKITPPLEVLIELGKNLKSQMPDWLKAVEDADQTTN